MIGGQDIHVPVEDSAAALDFAVRATRLRWPGAVFVADKNPSVITNYLDLDFRENSEILIYRDHASCEAWRKIGFDESLKGTMIYLICDPSMVTLVVEDEAPSILRSLVTGIQRGLESNFGRRRLAMVA